MPEPAPPTIAVHLRYFAVVRERLGRDAETVTQPHGATVADLCAELGRRHPALVALLPHLRVARNLDFVDGDAQLANDDEVALIPPVAGGTAPRARLTQDPLDPTAIEAQVRSSRHGAVVTFVGVVRDHSQGRAVSYLEYEVYPDMALAKLESILSEVDERWPEVRSAVTHRYGRLDIGDAAVVVVVAAPHRKDAFAACAYVIDRIKEVVPIWKREVGPDGESWVGMGS
jgi:molybdopterin converting factor subunit 1